MNIYELLALILSSVSILLWYLQREDSKEDRREKFFQNLISGLYIHNWKFIEHWNNPGIRPYFDETLSLEKNEEAFGRRIVTLDHINILWQAFLHRKVLTNTDLDSFKIWARGWFESSKDQLQVIFLHGDLYPLDFFIWLRDDVFCEMFHEVMGSALKERIKQYEGKQQ